MTILTGGLGQPESPIVTAGLGASEPAAAGAITAHLSGAGALTGALTGGDASTPTAPAGKPWTTAIPLGPQTIPTHVTAALTGAATLTADLGYTLDTTVIEDEINALLVLNLI